MIAEKGSMLRKWDCFPYPFQNFSYEKSWTRRIFVGLARTVYVRRVWLGLVRTVYTHRIRPYNWWFPRQQYRIYTVHIWFWPTLCVHSVLVCRKSSAYNVICMGPHTCTAVLLFSILENLRFTSRPDLAILKTFVWRLTPFHAQPAGRPQASQQCSCTW